jgi:hypothetical protein
VSCTLSLLKSSLRRSPLLKDDEYARQGSEDDRFVDSFGAIESIVTSSANSDSGMFDTNLGDARLLPFEGFGAVSTWKLELPAAFRQFDYDTISDLILHLRFTARDGGAQLRDKAVQHLRDLFAQANTSGLALLFSLRREFSSEWHRFVTAADGPFTAVVKRDYFPYFTQGRRINIDAIQLDAIVDHELRTLTPQGLDLGALTDSLNESQAFELSLAADSEVLVREHHARVFLLIKYSMESI